MLFQACFVSLNKHTHAGFDRAVEKRTQLQNLFEKLIKRIQVTGESEYSTIGLNLKWGRKCVTFEFVWACIYYEPWSTCTYVRWLLNLRATIEFDLTWIFNTDNEMLADKIHLRYIFGDMNMSMKHFG